MFPAQLRNTPATLKSWRARLPAACEIASKEASPLIVSSSGDGGYNEVINGVCASSNRHAICAVLPAGNANDYGRTMHDKPLDELIIKKQVSNIDLLEVTIKSDDNKTTRYAHSYVGLGITPVVAVELNRHSLNAVKEAWIIIRTFFRYRPFKIKHGSQTLKLDSLIFANINQMAKVLTLSPTNHPRDGKFEVVLFPAGHKWTLVKRVAEAAVSATDTVERANRYTFIVLKKMPMQLDGEIWPLRVGSHVTITSAQRRLRTIV